MIPRPVRITHRFNADHRAMGMVDRAKLDAYVAGIVELHNDILCLLGNRVSTGDPVVDNSVTPGSLHPEVPGAGEPTAVGTLTCLMVYPVHVYSTTYSCGTSSWSIPVLTTVDSEDPTETGWVVAEVGATIRLRADRAIPAFPAAPLATIWESIYDYALGWSTPTAVGQICVTAETGWVESTPCRIITTRFAESALPALPAAPDPCVCVDGYFNYLAWEPEAVTSYTCDALPNLQNWQNWSCS